MALTEDDKGMPPLEVLTIEYSMVPYGFSYLHYKMYTNGLILHNFCVSRLKALQNEEGIENVYNLMATDIFLMRFNIEKISKLKKYGIIIMVSVSHFRQDFPFNPKCSNYFWCELQFEHWELNILIIS